MTNQGHFTNGQLLLFFSVMSMILMLIISPAFAQETTLETGTYAGMYEATARTVCDDGFEETFQTEDLLELDLTLEIESVSDDAIVIEGNTFESVSDGMFSFTTGLLFDEEQNIEFTDTVTVEITSETEIAGTYVVDYVPEEGVSCTNTFVYTAEKVSEDDSDAGMGMSLETGTYEGMYEATARTVCDDGFEETFQTEDLLELDLTLEVESVSDDAIVIEDNTFEFVSDGVFTFTTGLLFDEEQNIEFTDTVTVEITSETEIAGTYVVDYVPEEGVSCTNTFVYTAEKVSEGDSDAGMGMSLETGTYEGMYEATARTVCDDGFEETYQTEELLDLDFTIEIESVETDAIVIGGNTFESVSDGVFSFTTPPIVDEEQDIEFTDTYTVEITSETEIAGTYVVDYVPEEGISCTNTFVYTAEKSG